jgi:hypothetical protein
MTSHYILYSMYNANCTWFNLFALFIRLKSAHFQQVMTYEQRDPLATFYPTNVKRGLRRKGNMLLMSKTTSNFGQQESALCLCSLVRASQGPWFFESFYDDENVAFPTKNFIFYGVCISTYCVVLIAE